MEDNSSNILSPNTATARKDLLTKTTLFGEYVNLEQCPPDLDLCKEHAKAKVYRAKHMIDPTLTEIPSSIAAKTKVCRCCHQAIEGEKIPLTCDLDELYHLGSGYALYFRFMKYLICIFWIMFAFGACFNLISDAVEEDCAKINHEDTLHEGESAHESEEYCEQDFVVKYSIANKRNHQNLLRDQMILNFVSMILVMIFFHYMRYRCRSTEIEVDDKTITPADYTVAVGNIDPDVPEAQIVEFLQKLATPENPINIQTVVAPYANHAKRHKDHALTRKKGLDFTKSLTIKDHTHFNQKILHTSARIHDLLEGKVKRTTTIYVTLETAQQSSFLKERLSKSNNGFVNFIRWFKPTYDQGEADFFNRRVHIDRAPEPSDICWENLGYTNQEKFRSRVWTNFLSMVFLGISFGIILLIKWGQIKLVEEVHNNEALKQFLPFLVSIVILVANKALHHLVEHLTEEEKHWTHTGHFKAEAQKLSIAKLINTALVPFLAEVILPSEKKVGNKHLNFYETDSFLLEIFWVFVLNVLLAPIVGFSDYKGVFKRIKRHFLVKSGKIMKLTQAEANMYYQGSNIGLPSKYSKLIKILLFCALYAPVLPIGVAMCIFGLSFYYWVEKYNILRRAAVPKSIGYALSLEMVEFTEWATCLFAIGNLAVVYTLKNSHDEYAFDNTSFVLAWILLGITLINIFLPMEKVNEWLFPIKDDVTENTTYAQEAETNILFRKDYYREYRKTQLKFIESLEGTVKNLAVHAIHSPSDAPDSLLPLPRLIVSEVEVKEKEDIIQRVQNEEDNLLSPVGLLDTSKENREGEISKENREEETSKENREKDDEKQEEPIPLSNIRCNYLEVSRVMPSNRLESKNEMLHSEPNREETSEMECSSSRMNPEKYE